MSYFFFFKQKTAYEMRISDWSSDVCSSDLVPLRKGRRGTVLAGPRLLSTVHFLEAGEAGGEVGDEVVAMLQPGMDAQGRAGRVPAGRGAHGGGVGQDHEALEAAPARADAEELDAVDQRHRRLAPAGLQDDAEEARGAGEVAPPDRVPGIGRQRRIEQAVDLRALAQPFGQPQRVDRKSTRLNSSH